MLKSLMLAVACAYINPPGLQPNAPVVQATVPEILKQAHAMEPGTQKEIIIDHGDGLCSKVMIERSTDEALNAFIDPNSAKSLPCRCDDCREDHGRKRRVSKKHEDESSKQSARQCQRQQPFSGGSDEDGSARDRTTARQTREVKWNA